MKACVLPRCATELSLGCLHGLCCTDISLLQAIGAAWSPVRLCMPLQKLSAYISSKASACHYQDRCRFYPTEPN